MTEIERLKSEIVNAEYNLTHLRYKLKDEIDKQTKKYRHGQWFKRGPYGRVAMLCQVKALEYCLIGSNGNRESNPKLVKSHELTLDEVKRLGCFTSDLVPVSVKIIEV